MDRYFSSRRALIQGALVLAACNDDPDEVVTTYLGIGDPPVGAQHASCPAVDQELNDSIPTAEELPALVSCHGTVKGVVAGSDDVDYFRFTGNPGESCAVPSARVTGDVRVCIFPECSEGATEIGGCRAGTARYLPSGLAGCCSDAGGDAEPATFACTDPAATASAHVYLRVDLTQADQACHEYAIDHVF